MAEARETGTPVAELSLDQIARRAGVSRSTIYRRVRNRRALDDAVRKAGADPGSRVGVADRAVAAATDVIIADGVAALTVDGVARRVGCSVSAVHTAFGGREGLLAAVFERHAPLPTVVQLMADHPGTVHRLRKRCADDLHGGVRHRQRSAGGTGVLEALFAEVLAKPNGVGAQLFRDRILPRITANIGGWLTDQIDARPLRRPTALAARAVVDLADQRSPDRPRPADRSRCVGTRSPNGHRCDDRTRSATRQEQKPTEVSNHEGQ